ncbi:MAG: hypothetical protein AAFQ63_06230, partial [Cyanobacteria bacterium J06621_11]
SRCFIWRKEGRYLCKYESDQLVLAQLKVDDKSNGIAAISMLLEVLDLQGCIVTIDAMDT